MTDLGMLRHSEVLQDGSGCNHPILEMLYTETLQILHLKVLEQLFTGLIFGKDPILQLVGVEFCSEVALEHRPFTPIEEHLFRIEVV